MESLSGLGKTALGVARVRAEESTRPDRLFDDPYAAAFLASVPATFPDVPAGGGPLAAVGAAFHASAVVRTRFFDDYLIAACAHGCRQVVLLAAGLDSRAFRLHWPRGVRLFELDLPAVLEVKERVLRELGARPGCERTALPADLRGAWAQALAGAGFHPTEPTAWLLEGLLIYLSAEESARVLSAVDEASAPGSQLAVEHGAAIDSSLLACAQELPAMREFTALWKGGLGADLPGWLTRRGWSVAIHDGAALAASYGRPYAGSSSSGLLTAQAARLSSGS